MNIEIKKMLYRSGIHFGFYFLVMLIGFLLLVSGGGFGSGSGTGTGSGNGSGGRGGGSGKGSAESGWGPGAGKDGLTGTGNIRVEGKEEAGSGGTEEKAKPEEKSSPQAAPGPAAKQPAPQKTLITVVGQGDLSEDMPMIHVPGKPAPAAKGSATPAAKGFFGVKVGGSSRVLFLLDVSGSMGAGTSEGMRRIDLLKKEMARTLQDGYKEAVAGKSSNGVFRIVTFESSCGFYPNSTRSCYYRNRSDVEGGLRFISNMNAGGGTAMLLAWKTILPIIAANKITTVCFLSDGAPNDCSPPQLLDLLKKSAPELVIHGIAMGLKSDLLQAISKQHGGTYREVY